MSDEPIPKPTKIQGKAARERLISLAVIVECRETNHRWQKQRWQAVGLEPGVEMVEPWTMIDEGEGYVRYRACILDLDLHRKETEGYKYNLAGQVPAVYVLMRPSDDPAHPFEPVELSVSPYDALSGTEVGDDQVDAVPMPETVLVLVQGFVDRHHVDQPFVKRKRKGKDKKLGDLSDFRVLDRRSMNGGGHG